MKKKKRKTRVDSTASLLEIIKAADYDVAWPESLSFGRKDILFFNAIIEELGNFELTRHKIDIAAILAMAMADLENEYSLMRSEGSILNHSSKRIVNPRKSLIQMHLNTILSFRRSLGLHACAQGDIRDVQKRRAIAKVIESKFSGPHSDLIPR